MIQTKKIIEFVKENKEKIFIIVLVFLVLILCITIFSGTYGRITEAPTGTSNSRVEGNTVYVDDLLADYHYLKGLNYAEIRSTSIPSGTSTGFYDNDYLVKVTIIYDGADINNSSLVGAVSPINNETANKYIYYKYYALARDSSGNLTTNSDGNNYIRIELIDNPFSKRPYVNSIEYGFNGWVCNQGNETTAGLCENSTISFNQDDYTRYMDVPVNNETELTIHLNASWYEADVVTSYNDISDFNSMSMQPTFYTQTQTIHHRGYATWKQNYTQMVYSTSYNYNAGYLPVGVWYRANRNSGTYNYVSQANSVRADRWFGNTTYYVFNANTTAIAEGTQYTSGSYTFVPNFNATGSNTEITINSFDATYMNYVEDPNGTYQYDEQVQVTLSYLPDGANTSGYYYQVSNPTSAMIDTGEYYTSTGNHCTSANSCTTAYKLIQSNDSMNNSNGNTISSLETVNNRIIDANKYYYLVTRDMNIFRYTSSNGNGLTISNLQVNRPYTVTGTAVNGTTATGILNLNTNSFTASNDIVIENIRMRGPDKNLTNTNYMNRALDADSKTSGVIYANSKNLKIGRNVTPSRGASYLMAESVFGGTNNAGPSGTSRVIIESGIYYAYHSGAMSGSNTYTMNETTILGSDYDRATPNNNLLRFTIGLDGFAGGHHNAGNDSLFASYTIVKSGTYGYNYDGTANTDNTAGMYIGGRASTCVNSLTGAKIEGGKINTIVGGYGYNGTVTTNSTYIGMSGGTVRAIYGGAGHSTTKGNRIINVTGGTVSYSVLGGSDSYSSTATDDGVVQGSTLVYVGGTVLVGDGSTGELNGVAPGSVFGAGGGNSNPQATSKGTVYNSHVIINGGTITDSVYGGGNFGSTGTQNNAASTAVIDVYAGTIGNVYGGSKSAGFAKSNYASSSVIDINVMGGTIGNVYGGSNDKGTINGSIDIDITGGSITNNVYGGGRGNETVVTNNVDVTIGTSGANGVPVIGGSVYGGSALGTVNGASGCNTVSSYSTHVVVNSGDINNVFGGGQGDNSNNTPYVCGNVTVDVNNGEVDNVFGGNDLKGTPNGTVTVNVNGGTTGNAYAGGNQTTVTEPYINLLGGTVTNAFGGGNNAAVTTSHVLVDGATVTNVFGGSNSSGNVTTSNVVIDSGTVGSAYGGNNIGGTVATSNVTTNGGTITNVYGGGNQAVVTTSHVSLDGGTITNAFGGGNQAGVTTTNVSVDGATVTNAFGGSNSSGNVTTSNVVIDSGTVTSAYGGNNVGGTTATTNVTANGGAITNVYGGGEQTNVTTTTNVNINCTVTNVFGGSDSNGTVANTIVNINSGSDVTTVYGGNNLGGTTTVSHVNVVSGTADEVYGGGLQADTTSTNVVLNNGTVINVYGGGYEGDVTGNTTISITNSAITEKVYGGGYEGEVGGNTTITITGSTVDEDVFGGGNEGDVAGTTTVTISNSTVTNNIFGGGNQAVVEDDTTVVVNNNSTCGNIFGGGNNASVEGSTNVTINGATCANIFGGGNNGMVIENATTTITNATVTGSAYAGGNGSTAIVIGNNKINVEGTTAITGHVFGGGNAAATGCGSNILNSFNEVIYACSDPNTSSSEVNIAGATIGGNVYGGANTSVVYGETFVNIGINTITDNLTSGNISIAGNVFGGGEANASGSEDYDFSFISVTEGININIDATSHNTYTINGSIFGSGNASSSGGYSYIYIKNYGTLANPKRNISIQRTDIVTLDNSSMLLSGAQDRTNKYKNELFTLSRIGELKLKNNSSLYLEKGANLLESFSSLVDVNNTEVEASVDIENGVVTKNVDNRLYMFEGKNLNISDDESLGTFGIVEGMTFFGMFKIDRNGNVATGLYSNVYHEGETVSGSELYYFSSGSYVVGKHKSNHDIYEDGFYSHFRNEEGTGITVDYIEPTPSDATYYRWVIGESVETLEVNITASKYSTLGTSELQLMDYYHPNTEIHVLGVNYDGLNSDINLLPSDDIPRYANNANDANTNFGLAMKTGTIGWITRGGTEFSTSNPEITGNTYYKAENSNAIPSFVFYLYHSKNITETKELGTATISLMVVTPIDDLSNRIQRINVEVTMNSAFYEGNNYEASIAPGAQYELFANTNVNITNKSTFSTYFSLYSTSATSIYRSGYARYLVSNYAYPVNTKITMIDFASSSQPEYYYFIIDQTTYDNSVLALANDNEISYPLSNFIRMGSSSAGNTYNDSIANNNYYDSTLQKAEEEFIFIVDFKDTAINTDVLNKSLLLELRDSATNNPIIPVLDISAQKMFYNLYNNKDGVLSSTATLSNDTLYIGQSIDLNVITSFSQQTLGNITIIDTNYYDKRLGIKLSLYNSNNQLVNGATLLGTAFVYNGVRYYPRQDGTVRFNIAESIANVSSRIKIDAEKSNIPSGSYRLIIETFGSADGIYYGVDTTSTIQKNITIVNEAYGLDATASNEDVIIDKNTGLSQDGNDYIEYQVSYQSGLTNPNIRLSLYRRTYTDAYDYTYQLVDLQDYVSSTLDTTNEQKVYLIRSLPASRFRVILNMNDNLMTGTYQLRFSLYDGNNYVGHINKYIIIE